MGVEQLNPQGAWRLIVARLGGIHNVPAHLTALTGRHRAKLADAARDTPRRFAARLHVGPSFVRRIAQHMREAGIDVTIESTEHIHYKIDALSPDAVPHNTLAAFCQSFPPSPETYCWSWVTSNVSDVQPADRFIVSPWHGEGRSVFYVLDSTAPEDSQPLVVADYPDRESADRHAAALNLAEGMASGRIPLTPPQTF